MQIARIFLVEHRHEDGEEVWPAMISRTFLVHSHAKTPSNTGKSNV
jgi:hypothetical protein